MITHLANRLPKGRRLSSCSATICAMTTTVDAPVRNVMEILDSTGDTKVMWDRHNAAEVSIARAAFDAARAKGASIFQVKGKNGDRGKRLTEFDPDVERMIVVPQMVGG